jgi:hypothetical protein
MFTKLKNTHELEKKRKKSEENTEKTRREKPEKKTSKTKNEIEKKKKTGSESFGNFPKPEHNQRKQTWASPVITP